MAEKNNPPTKRGQENYADDFLAEMLRRGEAPSLDALLSLCPDEPLAELEPGESMKLGQVRGVGWTLVPRNLTKASRAFAEKFPGLQLSYRKREEMKYGNTPPDGAPLSEFVRARVSHAKALWSRDVQAKQTRLQFREWLPGHLDDWLVLWPDWEGWSEALQILRIACGLPHFAPRRSAGR